MTLGPGQNVAIADLLVEHASDGSHSGVSNLISGLNASKSATPDVGDVYIATDTSQYYACYVDDAWTQIGAGADEKAKVSSDDTTAGYLNGKLVAGTDITLTENNPAGNETLTIAHAAANTHVPANVIAYFNGAVASIPAGWTEFTAARGRTIVGVPASGTVGGTVGTALTDVQDKSTTHTHTGPSHTHTGPSHQHEAPFTTFSGPWLAWKNAGNPLFGTGSQQTTDSKVQGASAGNTNATALVSASGTGATGAGGTGATGTGAVTTGDVTAYIQQPVMVSL